VKINLMNKFLLQQTPTMGMGSSSSVAAYPMPNMLIGDYSPHQQANVLIPQCDFTGVGRDSMQQLVTGYRQ
jgi:hypothetical protein